MYMREARRPVPVSRIPFGLGLALAVSIAATLYLGILPDRILQYAQQSAAELRPLPPEQSVENSSQMQAPATIPER